MILCTDIGNTNIVLGLFESKDSILPIQKWRLHTNTNLTADEYSVKIMQLLEYAKINSTEIEGIIVSSVVPQLDLVFSNVFQKLFNKKVFFVGPGLKSGIKIKLDNPKQLGADLLVGAVAAVNKYGAPVIVIDIGTAATISYINANKEFLGGVIMPGIKTAYSGLFANTAKLESVKAAKPEKVIGKDTITSIQSGMVFGYASMMDGMIKKIKAEQGDAQVVMTGGETRHILDILEEKVIYDDDLLLEGLKTLYTKNI